MKKPFFFPFHLESFTCYMLTKSNSICREQHLSMGLHRFFSCSESINLKNNSIAFAVCKCVRDRNEALATKRIFAVFSLRNWQSKAWKFAFVVKLAKMLLGEHALGSFFILSPSRCWRQYRIGLKASCHWWRLFVLKRGFAPKINSSEHAATEILEKNEEQQQQQPNEELRKNYVEYS